MRGVRLQWAVLIAQGGSRGRAGSSWFLSLSLRLAINVFSCIFSNGVTRNAPVSHKLMCRWSCPSIYIYLTDAHPPVTLIRTCLSNKAAGISSYLQTERTSKLSSPYPPGGVTERTACKGAGLSRQGGFND